ncbi:MAG TPA: methyltransferase domain-containing protein [Stellaceae bacterium]|nr:methyltransferase domain-containing protein [Stellaceae bacterium]
MARTGAIRALSIAAVLGFALLGGDARAQTPNYAAIVAAPDRTDADRQTDKRRDPTDLLAFTGARPGMRVLDMGSGAGYSTELMARAVAPGGVVYAQDSEAMAENQKEKFGARAMTAAMKNVVRDVRPYDDPLPPDVRDLDLVTFFFWYHDTTYLGVDRAKMDKALFNALRPGGYLILADHSAASGAGATVGKTFHRIEEATVKQELEAAGFKLVDEGNFLHNPEDKRDTIVFKSPVPVDEFVLKFQRPQ